jgi:hypothetical protein
MAASSQHKVVGFARQEIIPAAADVNFDDFVNKPISVLRVISLPLRRTVSTPRGTRFARLDLGLFTKSSIRMT